MRGACVSSLQILLLLENDWVKTLEGNLLEYRIIKSADPYKMTRALKAAYKEAQE